MQKIDTDNLSFKDGKELIDSVIDGYKTSVEIYFSSLISKFLLQIKEALLFLLYSLIAGILFIGALGFLVSNLVSHSFYNLNFAEHDGKLILSGAIIAFCLVLYLANKIKRTRARFKMKKENDVILQKAQTAKTKIFNTLQEVTKNPLSTLCELFFSNKKNTPRFSLETLGTIIIPKLTILNLAILSIAAYFLFKKLFKTSAGHNPTSLSQPSQTLDSQIKSAINGLVLATITTYFKEFIFPSPKPVKVQREPNICRNDLS